MDIIRQAPEAASVLQQQERLIAYMTGGVLAASVILGGGTRSGFLGDVVLQVLSLFLLCAAINQLIISRSVKYAKGPLIFAATLALLPLAQLIPLPMALWKLLPGRDVISQTYELIHEGQPQLPLSMSPSATWLSGLAILPPLSIFLACLTLYYRQRRALSIVVIAMAVISVVLGLLQLAQGPHSPLRFYDFTNNEDAVGFFANRNHFAALLYSAMIFAAVWLVDAIVKVGLQPRRTTLQSTAVLLFVASLLSFVALVVAQMMARSRAGIGLSIVGLFASFALALTDGRAASSRAGSAKIMFGFAAVAIIVSLQFSLYRILERFAADPLADARIPFARNTIAAAKAYMPFGSGLGTFVPVYQMFEKPADIFAAYANHAHNDLLEVWLETGVIGLALIAVFLIWFARRTFSTWRGSNLHGGSEVDVGLAKAATLVIALLLVHSLVDYPLRTAAIEAIAAFACGLLVPPRSTEMRDNQFENADPLKRDVSLTRSEGLKSRQREPQDARGDTRVDVPSSPRPREPWGQSIEWPEAWREAKTSPKNIDGSDKKKS